MIYFITGNINKYEEAKAILSEIEQLDIDLQEIQSIDAREIIKSKLQEAFKHKEGEFIVEDTSLYLECLDGLPGPLTKWFLKTIGTEGIANIVEKLGNNKAIAKTIIGYGKNRDEINFFEGEVPGQIVKPIGVTSFGWDPIFLPDGYGQTFAQMDKAEKNKISMRRVALDRLTEFLGKQK